MGWLIEFLGWLVYEVCIVGDTRLLYGPDADEYDYTLVGGSGSKRAPRLCRHPLDTLADRLTLSLIPCAVPRRDWHTLAPGGGAVESVSRLLADC